MDVDSLTQAAGSALLAQPSGRPLIPRRKRQFGGTPDPAGSIALRQAVKLKREDNYIRSTGLMRRRRSRYVAEAQRTHHLSGDGYFTKRVINGIEAQTGCAKAL